jgi:cytoskeleton protein RodZ
MSKKTMTLSNDDTETNELSEHIEVVGPGQMLSEARQSLSLTTEDVAKKLNFKTRLVENIEQDLFDQKLPATYNRGYLRSYAKLVNVDVIDVFSSYDMLGVAEVQRSEMQSFSNLTEKQAEHSRLMWFSYFIVAILCGLMILWWQQEPKLSVDEKISADLQASSTPAAVLNTEAEVLVPSKQTSSTQTPNDEVDPVELAIDSADSDQENIPNTTNEALDDLTEDQSINTISKDDKQPDVVISTAVFTFSGDCWVNIFDATGERIAWGVKKSGYVMTVNGQAPLKVTLGRPELATIMFDEQPIDMSTFSKGNIAKFTLPLNL